MICFRNIKYLKIILYTQPVQYLKKKSFVLAEIFQKILMSMTSIYRQEARSTLCHLVSVYILSLRLETQ